MTLRTTNPHGNIFILFPGKDVKVEMRDHDHVVECVAWAPEVATQAINEAARDAAGGDNKNRSVSVDIEYFC